MVTAVEGGVTAYTTASTTTTSSYGGGGAGGKFRKRPFRKQTTPYDRPLTVLRENNDDSWLKKLVVDPASKLISYGASRLFTSVFRNRLTLPPPPATEVNHDSSEGLQGMISNEQDRTGGECSQLINSSSKHISDLEKLFNQKTFTRSEIDHLKDLLHSRVVKVSPGDEHKNNEEAASGFGRLQQFASGRADEIGNKRISSHDVERTPIFSSKVIEDDIASPAELAKAYMGNRPSNVSPSMLGTRGQVGMEDNPLVCNIMFASKSPMTARTSVRLDVPDNGFITPRSRGRSAIYNMARTPYSRFNPTSILKEGGFNNNGYARPSIYSSSESKSMTLKRRSSVLDDEVGSVGPIRRIKQKTNLAPRISHSAHGLGFESARRKLPLIGEPKHNVPNTVRQDENKRTLSTSYALVPSRSREVAARILQHLDNLSPSGKSSESRLVAGQDKLFKLKPHMLRGRALRSMDDVDSIELSVDVQDDHKVQDCSNAELNGHDLTSQKQGKVEENGSKESLVLSNTGNPAQNNGSVVTLKASPLSTRINDSVVRNGLSQPPQKKRVFRMSEQKDHDIHSDEVSLGPCSEGREPSEMSLVDNNLAPATDFKLVNTTIQLEVKSHPGPALSKTIGFSSGSANVRGEHSGVTFYASAEASVASESSVSHLTAAATEKPKEANNPAPFFSSKGSDEFPSSPHVSNCKMPEFKQDSSSSLINIPAPTGYQLKMDKPDKDGQENHLKIADGFGKSDTGASTTFVSSIFDSAVVTATPTAPFLTFSASTDPLVAVTAPSISNIREVLDLQTKSKIGEFGSGSSTFGLATPFHLSTTNNLNDSLFNNTSTSFMSGIRITPQGVSVEPVLSASMPSFTMNDNTSGSSPSIKSTFGFSPAASSSDAIKSCSVAKFSFGSSSVSDGSIVNPSSNSSVGGIFGIGASSFSSSISGLAGPPGFGFGSSSSGPVSVNSTSSSSSGTSGIFNFGGNFSIPASAISTSNTSSGMEIFNFGASSSTPASIINTLNASVGTPRIFNFGGNTSVSNNSNVFGTSWQNPNSSMFGSVSSSPAQSTGFGFTSSAPTNTLPAFPFTASSSLSTPSQSPAKGAFGNFTSGFGTSQGNNDRMNGEDSMAEDNPVQQQSTASVFGQPAFMFDQTAPTQPNPFQFNTQQNQVNPNSFCQTGPTQPNTFQFNTQQNQASPNTFQASSSVDFNPGGSFSLGSGGGDKSSRKCLKINRNNKNRKR